MNKTRNQQIFEDMPVAKAVQTMAVPAIISQLVILFYNMADTFFLGRTNNPLMVAGASLILPVFNLSVAISGLTGIGGGSLVSRLLGEKNEEEARKVSSFSICFAILSAALFALLVLLFLNPLISVLGAGPETERYAKGYALCVIVFGGIPTVLSNTLSNLLRSMGDSKKAGFGITMGGLINIALDPLFMFVLFPKGMEIIGAGAATCVSNCIACTYFILVIRKLGPESVISLRPSRSLPMKKSIMGVFSVGIPSSVAGMLFDLDYVVLDRLMSGYGDTALAAVGIVLKAERLPLNIGIGICQGMMPIVAYNYSAKNFRRMNDTKRFSRRLGLICAAFSILLYQLFTSQIMHFFINDAETVRLGIGFLRIRTLATPLMFLSFFHVYLFNAFGRGERALFLGVTRWVAFNIPMLFLLNYLIGMYGLVWSQVTADILTVSLSLYVYRRFEKQTHLV